MILKFLGQPNTGGFLSQRSVALIYVSAWDREKSCKKRWLGSREVGANADLKVVKGKLSFDSWNGEIKRSSKEDEE